MVLFEKGVVYEKNGERALHYQLLSSLFYDQSENEQLDSYIQTITELDKTLASGLNQSLTQLMNQINHFNNKEDGIREIAVEYAKLFLLPGAVVPYASYYLDGKELLKQEEWEKFTNFYYKQGWQLSDDESHLADHISVELAFMAKLVKEASHQVQSEFFFNHIYNWIPEFFEKIKAKSEADFYYPVVCYGNMYLQTEKERLS